MNSVFDINIAALQENYPDYSKLFKDDNTGSDANLSDNININIENVCGKNVLFAEVSGAIYQLDSLYDDKALLDLWFTGLRQEWPLDSKLLMFGFGSGMYVRTFLKNSRPDCCIIVHEPSLKVFKKVIENTDISDLLKDSRLQLVLGSDGSSGAICDYYKKLISYLDMKNLTMSVYLNYSKLFPTLLDEFISGIGELKTEYEASMHVYDRFSGYFCQNVMHNFKYIKDSFSYAKLTKLIPKGRTAIVVSAGPSLDKNIDELKRAEGKSFIIATVTALKPLALKGIKPDIAVITDAKKDGRYLSEADSRTVPMISSPVCGYEILQLHEGAKLFVDSSCNHIKTFMDSHEIEFPELDAGGSVANACFTVARECGCSAVILVGQDLAYTDDKTHSQVTVRGAWNTKVEELEHPIWDVDINGNPIRTSSEFLIYKNWFEEQFAACPNITVIDASEGGIKISGTQILTLKEAIDKYCREDFDFDEIMKQVPMLLDKEQQEQYCKYIQDIPNQINGLKRIIKETLADYSTMRSLVKTNRYHTAQMKKLYNDCKDNTDKVENSPIIEYVHYQLGNKSSELLETVNNLEDDERAELLSVCDMGQKYLEDMQQAIDELQPFIEEVKNDFCM